MFDLSNECHLVVFMFALGKNCHQSQYLSHGELVSIFVLCKYCHIVSIFVTWCAGEHFCSLQILPPSHTILSPGVYICSQGQLSPGGGGGGSPGDGGGGSPGEREGDGSRMPPPKAHSWTPIFTQ